MVYHGANNASDENCQYELIPVEFVYSLKMRRQVTKYKKYAAGKYTRASAPLARKLANRVSESKDGKTSMKY